MKRRLPTENETDTDELPICWVPRPRGVHDDGIITLLLSGKLSQKLGLENRTIVAFRTNMCYESNGATILYCDDETYNIGRVIYDEFTNLFAIDIGNNEFAFLSDVEVVGEPVGYCDAERINDKPLRFRKI